MLDFQKMLPWLRFMRIENIIMIALLMFVIRQGALAPLYEQLETGFRMQLFDFALLVLDLCIVAVTGYWINDQADRSIDAINRPERIMASGKLTGSSFWMLYSIAVVIGAIITAHLAWKYDELGWTWLYPFSVFSFWLYARFLKKQGLIGNALVSFFIAAIVFIVLIAEPALFQVLYIVEALDVLGALLFFAFIAFLANLAREWVKDCEDIEGDQAFGVRSLPILTSLVFTQRAAAVALFLILVLEGLMFRRFQNALQDWEAQLSFGIVGLTTLLIIWNVLRSSDQRRLRLVSRSLKLLMVLGLVQLVLVSLDLVAG